MLKVLLSLSIILSIILYPTKSFGECDFNDGVKKVENGYLYSSDCHKRVGKLVLDNADKDEQIVRLTKSIELKDLAITKQDKSIKTWMDTSFELEDRVNTIEQYKSTTNWIYFGLGIAFTGLAVGEQDNLRIINIVKELGLMIAVFTITFLIGVSAFLVVTMVDNTLNPCNILDMCL